MNRELEDLEELEADSIETLESEISRILDANSSIHEHQKTLSSSISSVPYTSLQYKVESSEKELQLNILYREHRNGIKIEKYNIVDRN